MRLRANGAAIWCIDTYRTKTADLADHFVAIRPGTDGALALGMMYVLVRDGLTDEAFLSANVLGWEEMKEKVNSVAVRRKKRKRLPASRVLSSKNWPMPTVRPERLSSAWEAASPATATEP